MTEKVVAVHRALDDAGIEHAFSGALALAYCTAKPRGTDDIDINIGVASRDAARVVRSLPAEVKWKMQAVRIAEVTGEVKTSWLGETAVDLFFMRNDYHRLVQQRKEYRPFPGAEGGLPFVTATDLTVFKALFARAQDWADIDSMLRSGTVDVAEALSWVENLGGAPARAAIEQAVKASTAPLPQTIPMLPPPATGEPVGP